MHINKPGRRFANTHRGGDFYKDKLNKLIEIIGHQLVTLYFIHVDELDLAALALISNCNQLETLGLCNILPNYIYYLYLATTENILNYILNDFFYR